MTDAPELKPCPFCGGEDFGTGGDDKFVGVWCRTCQATGPNHYGKHEWNTRADLSPSPDVARGLVEALKDVIGMLDDPHGGEHVRDMRGATIIACAALAAYEKEIRHG